MRKAVLFDLDDTIFDHQYSRRSALAALAQKHVAMQRFDLRVLELMHERHLQSNFHQVLAGQMSVRVARLERMRLLFEGLDIHLDPAELLAANGLYRQHYDAAKRAVPGVVAIIEALRPTMKIVVVTNGLVVEQEEKLQLCGLDGKLDAVVISERAGFKKPSREIFDVAVAQLGVTSREDVVMFGDS